MYPLVMKGSRGNRWLALTAAVLLALLLCAYTPKTEPEEQPEEEPGQIYLYGETHADDRCLEKELAIWGEFYADGMRQDGLGELYQRFLMLKEKLTAEGLFDAARKRPLPLLPRKVGIVTSASGAVLHDIRTVAGRRFPGLPLVLRPAQVQGDGAAEECPAWT